MPTKRRCLVGTARKSAPLPTLQMILLDRNPALARIVIVVPGLGDGRNGATTRDHQAVTESALDTVFDKHAIGVSTLQHSATFDCAAIVPPLPR